MLPDILGVEEGRWTSGQLAWNNKLAKGFIAEAFDAWREKNRDLPARSG
jgi:hypothetical protein